MDNHNDNSNNSNNSNVLILETLRSEFDTVLLQYKQVQTDYIDYLKRDIVNSKPTITYIKGQAFWGSAALSEGVAETIDDCKNACFNDSKCTGATFNPDKKYCWSRTGDGTTIPALENDYAIIPESVKYLNLLQSLNKRLTTINENILKNIEMGEPELNTQTKEREAHMLILNENVSKLDYERDKIDQQLRLQNNLDQAQNQSSLIITKNYYSYVLIFIFVVLAIILLVKIVLPMDNTNLQTSSSFSVFRVFILFAFLSVCLLIYHSVKK
jgi:hypothetical protein